MPGPLTNHANVATGVSPAAAGARPARSHSYVFVRFHADRPIRPIIIPANASERFQALRFLRCLLFKVPDRTQPNDFAVSFGLGDALQPRQKWDFSGRGLDPIRRFYAQTRRAFRDQSHFFGRRPIRAGPNVTERFSRRQRLKPMTIEMPRNRSKAVPSPGAAGECLGERQLQLGQGEGEPSSREAPEIAKIPLAWAPSRTYISRSFQERKF
jgi:hypothetical protein